MAASTALTSLPMANRARSCTGQQPKSSAGHSLLRGADWRLPNEMVTTATRLSCTEVASRIAWLQSCRNCNCWLLKRVDVGRTESSGTVSVHYVSLCVQLFLNGVSYGRKIPASCSSVKVAGLAGGHTYKVYLEAYPRKNKLPIRQSNVLVSNTLAIVVAIHIKYSYCSSVFIYTVVHGFIQGWKKLSFLKTKIDFF